MTRRRVQALLWILALAASCPTPAATARAATVDRYTLDREGIVLEVSAPRADILRIRAGRGQLPEDASWAVSAAVRSHLTPLAVESDAQGIVLRTAAAVARLDLKTLHVSIEDAAGHVLLADARGTALVLEGTPEGSGPPVRLRKVMPADAHYFGLGDKAGPLDRRGGSFVLWNTDAYGFGAATDPLYKAVPFTLGVLEGGGSFGLFFDNTWRTYFDFGRTERDVLSFGAEGGAVDYYVLVAAAPKAVVQAFAYLTGTAPLAPLWSLGFQQSRYSYATEGEARAIATRLRHDHIPADALYLDIDYQDRNRPFTVSPTAFPDLGKFVAELAAMDLRLVLITDLHIARAPGEGYLPYDRGVAADAFVHTPDAKPYVANVWPGAALFPDFSREPVRDWWGGLYADFVRAGVAGFWNDMNEPAVFDVRDKTMPLDVVHLIDGQGFAPRKATHAELHNVYGMLNSRATYEGLLRLAPRQRPFVLTRATYAGGQRYAATWTGDNTSSWEHLRLSVSMLANLGVSGIGYAGADVGGFTGTGPSAELLTRWFEIAAFTPLFRDHAGKGKPAQEPWAGGDMHEAIRRHYIEERYRLLPYLYSLAEEYSRTGVPLLRPVYLEFPEVVGRGEGLGGSDSEFMLGPDLLIAPAPQGESPYPYSITLPGDGWYDYWTGVRLAGAKVVETPELERLPVFVRPGAILVRQPLTESTHRRPDGPLEIDVYPGANCHGELYLDDGISFDYRDGGYLRRTISCRAAAGLTTIEFGARSGSYRPWWTGIDVVLHGVPAVPRMTRSGKRAVSGTYEAGHATWRVHLVDDAGPMSIAVGTTP